MPGDVQVAIVGGGLAGLFTAVELRRRGVDDLLLLDAGDRPGGLVQTIECDGYLIEPGAGAVMAPHPHLSPILDTAGVDLAPAVDASTRHLLTGDGLVAVPPGPKAVLAPVMSWRAKLRTLAEPALRTRQIADDETLATFLRRHFGHEAGAVLGHLMASGVYAGDPNRLSAAAAFPNLMALEDANDRVIPGALARRRLARKAGVPRPVTHVPLIGMSGLSATLARHLGDAWRPSTPVEELASHDGAWIVATPEDEITARHVVFAGAPASAAELLDGDLAETLMGTKAAPVAVVALGGPGPALPPGFGYLPVPDVDGIVAGGLFESSYAPHRAPDGAWLLKTIVGGARHPEAVDLDDAALLVRVHSEAEAALGRDLDPTMTRIIRHRPGIPQYDVGHTAWLAEVDRLVVAQPGLHLTGWAYRGVGVSHLATDAVRIADAVADRSAGPAGQVP